MAVRGSGPSRRSHTKSRKGCKTCKKRHIRCDESFPQCRNCTKHRVQCDYLGATTPDSDGISATSSVQTSPTPTPSGERSGSQHSFDSDPLFSELGLNIPQSPYASFGANPELIQNLYSIAENLDNKGASDLTPWVSMIRRHLALAQSDGTLLDALKAFSAGQRAWVTSSDEIRRLALQYASSALHSLHPRVGAFNKHNADGVLVTSMLLATQSRDWNSWSSLLSGLKGITGVMAAWEQESLYPDLVRHMNTMFAGQPSEFDGMTVDGRAEIFKNLELSLKRLRPYLVGRSIELHWIDQFVDLVRRLQTTPPARNAEEGFNHLYVLRKWVFWLPVLLLESGPVDMTKLAVLAHLYAMPLIIGPTFPRLGESMCGYAASTPLMNVLSRMQAMQAQMGYLEQADYQIIMQVPTNALAEFNARNPWSPSRANPPMAHIPDISMFVTDENQMPGSLSPAFVPVNYQTAHSRESSAASTFLSVPTPTSGYTAPVGFTQTFSHFGSFPSPSIPSQDFFSDESLLYSDDDQHKHMTGQFGGFLQPCEIWT